MNNTEIDVDALEDAWLDEEAAKDKRPSRDPDGSYEQVGSMIGGGGESMIAAAEPPPIRKAVASPSREEAGTNSSDAQINVNIDYNVTMAPSKNEHKEEEKSGHADAPTRQVEIPSFRGLRRSQEELAAKNKAQQESANSKAIRGSQEELEMTQKARQEKADGGAFVSSLQANSGGLPGAVQVGPVPVPSFRGLGRSQEELEAKMAGANTGLKQQKVGLAPVPSYRGLSRSQEEIEAKRGVARANTGAEQQKVGSASLSSFRGLSRSQQELEAKRGVARANTGAEQKAGQVQIPAFRGLRRSSEELQAKQSTQASSSQVITPSSMPTLRGLSKQRGRPPRSDDLESGQEELQLDESSAGDDRETDSELSLQQDLLEADSEDQAASDVQLSQDIVEEVEAAGDDEIAEALQQADPAPETAPEPRLSTDASTSDLVEATPVLEEEEPPEGRMEAQPVDLEAEGQKELKQKRQRLGFTLISVLCLVVAAITGAVLGTRQQPVIPVINVTAAPSFAPSASVAPSFTPSNAPTTTVDLFQSNLPKHTQDSLGDEMSAQSQALIWLSEHPEFYSMTEERREQLFAMATFYYSLGGPNWPEGLDRDWLNPAVNECDWFSRLFGSFASLLTAPGTTYAANENDPGSPCNSNGTITTLYLSDLNLAAAVDTPAIPPEVQLLTSLGLIQLEGNSINTALSNLLPSQLGQISTLGALILQNQNIRGSIPSHIGLMTNLDILEISRNAITGPIPTEIGLMQKMIGFNADNNALTGPIPSEIGLLTNLFSLPLDGNALTGTIPSELGLLTDLINIDLEETLITGSLPVELFQLTDLLILRLPEGVLQGTTPTELGLLTNLMIRPVFNDPEVEEEEEEEASTNSILSNEILNTDLMVLALDGRSLTGTIPTEIGLLKSVLGINLSSNSLSGPIPSELALCTSLISLRLGGNFLTGFIPSELGLFGDQVLSFDLHGNSLTGDIPSELGLLQGAIKFDLSDNRLGSSIFTEVGLLSDVAMLYLQNNSLVGTIPSEMGLLDGYISEVPDLRINLSNNSLVGPIPGELASTTALKILHLADNDLSGTIPEELVSLVANGILSDLDLRGNAFSGVVSNDLCELQDDSCTWYDGIQAEAYLPCHFSFDCSDVLCGCNCTCS